jgi:hypothetical protein
MPIGGRLRLFGLDIIDALEFKNILYINNLNEINIFILPRTESEMNGYIHIVMVQCYE